MVATNDPGSYYTLELSVAPGGCRRDDRFVLTDLAQVKRVLTRDLAQGIGVYLISWYGEIVMLRVHVPGQAPQEIDLLPLVTVHLPGYPEIRFPGGVCDFDFEADEQAHEEEDDWLSSKLFQDRLTPLVTIDWDAAAIPALPEPLLPADSQVHVHHWGHLQPAIYGHNDLEGNGNLGLGHPLLAR